MSPDNLDFSKNARWCSRTARAHPKMEVTWRHMRARERWFEDFTFLFSFINSHLSAQLDNFQRGAAFRCVPFLNTHCLMVFQSLSSSSLFFCCLICLSVKKLKKNFSWLKMFYKKLNPMGQVPALVIDVLQNFRAIPFH